MQTIGEKIKELRKEKGVSQEETAFELGVSRQTVSKWESGLMQPNAESIKALSDYFAVSPVCFFGGENTAEKTAASQAAPAPTKGKKTAFIICLVLLIVSVIAFTFSMWNMIGVGINVFKPNRGFITVSNYSNQKPIFIGILTGNIISFCAIVGLVVALIKLRK